MTQTIIWTIAILTILGVVLAVVLYVVAKKFHVEEDPRIDDVEKELPGANCGGCGQAGCRAFAQSCVEAEDLDKCFCPVGGNDVMQKVAAVLGREVAAKEPDISHAVSRLLSTAEIPVVRSAVSDVETALQSASSVLSKWTRQQVFQLWIRTSVLPAVPA